MRTYKFGTINAWLDNREPVADIWKAYVTNHLKDEVVFVYEDNELVGTIACDDALWDRWNILDHDTPKDVRERFVEFLFQYIKDNLK